MTRSLPWIIAGVSAGIATAYIMMNQPRWQSETGWDSVENSADRTSGWGSKARISGAGTSLKGKLKEGVGRIAGDSSLANEGAADQAVGSVKDAVGTAAQAAGQTIHDLNR